MHSPGRFELILGLFFVVPGVIAAIFVDALPVAVLFDPTVFVDSLRGALLLGVWGLLSERVAAIPQAGLLLGLAVLALLYYVGLLAVVVSVVSIVRTPDNGQ